MTFILEEICVNHLLGIVLNNREVLKKLGEEYKYCSGCINDEGNKKCPYYKRYILGGKYE